MPKSTYHISQNFLTGRRVIEGLLRLTDLTADDTVVEIGAGKGHITRLLSRRCTRVLAWEIDPHLCAHLRETLPAGVSLRQGDFLRARLPAQPFKVFANIPFCITTAIVRRLTEPNSAMSCAWLVMEKGAAQRFCGSSENGLLLKPWWRVRILHQLRREDFHPMPGVDCVLLEIRRRPTPDLPRSEHHRWAQFLHQARQQGLRTLMTKRQIHLALRVADIPPSATMRYVQWLCLFRRCHGLVD